MTLADAFREAGYRTACIGKWHLGSEPFSLPEHHGFDVNIRGNAHGAPGSYFYPYEDNWPIPGTELKAKWNVLPDGQDGEYLSDRLTDEAVRFIRDNQDRPFFLYFPHYGVHTPIQAKPGTAAKYEQIPDDQRQGMPEYAAMVESVDDSVGRVMHLLDELKLAEKTTVIFTSDNGGFWKATRNTPLRANKRAYYEGGIRVPLIIRSPRLKQHGMVIDELEISNDLEKDPSEKNKLVTVETKQVTELHRELVAWRQSVGAEPMQPNPDYDPESKPAKEKKTKE